MPVAVKPFPDGGDVVIATDATGGPTSYVLSLGPNPAQVRCRTFEDATAMAARWASTRGATMWFRDGSQVMPIAADGSGSIAEAGAATDGLAHLLTRVESEFLEMPGLRLTCQQAQRLWALDGSTCATVLDALIERQFLVRGADDRYRRATDGAPPRRR